MYEDKTFENIMADMLEEVEGEDIDKSEGSLVWNAVSKMAVQLEEAYEAIADTYDNLMVDTMDLDHLVMFGAEIGIPIIEAKPATFMLQTNCEFEEGEVFEHTEQDLSYTIIEVLDAENFIYKVESDDPGTEPNRYLGEVEPEEFKEEFETGELIELLTAGTDEEEEETYRERLMSAWETRGFAGNRAYYVEEIGKMDGVGAVKAERATDQQNTVKLTILNAQYEAPSQTLINSIQELVDPTDASGEGDGIAPVGARVTVTGASEIEVTIQGTLILEDEIDLEDIESNLNAAVDDYFIELAEKWQSTDGQTVRRAKIESKIVEVGGVADVISITLNGAGSNVNTTGYQIAKRGTTTWTIQT